MSAFQALSPEDKEIINKETNELDKKSELPDPSIFPIYQKVMQIIILEQKILLEDINTFIDDLKMRKMDS